MFKGQRSANLLEFFRNLAPQALFFGCAVYFMMALDGRRFSLALSDVKQTLLVVLCFGLWVLSVLANGWRFVSGVFREDHRAAAIWDALIAEKRGPSEVFLHLLQYGWRRNKRWLMEMVFALVVIFAALIPMTMLAYQSAASLYKLSIESAALASSGKTL